MPTEKSFHYHAEARGARNRFYLETKPLVEQLARVLNDRDLNPEAKARRAAPLRKEIEGKAEAFRALSRQIVERAQRRERDVAPDRLRRVAALEHPGRAAEFSALFRALPMAELSAIAEELERADRPDRAAMFALVGRLRDLLAGEDGPMAAETIARADRWLDGDLEEVRADRLVAQHEALQLELDADAALGRRFDPMRALAGANALGATDAQIEAAYKFFDADRSTPLRHAVPEESAKVLEQLGALERLLSNTIPGEYQTLEAAA